MPDALWMNGPEYTSAELRRAMAMLLWNSTDDGFGAHQGIHPAAGEAVTLAGSTITVHNIPAVAYPAASSLSGPYIVQLPSADYALTPADGALDRTDIVWLQLQDDDEDASTFRRAQTGYTAGSPGGGEPAAPAGAYTIATIDVPASGTGAATLSYNSPLAVASGGVLPIRNTAGLPTAGLYDGAVVWNMAERLLQGYYDGDWHALSHQEIRGYNVPSAAVVGLADTERSVTNAQITIPSYWNTYDLEYVFTHEVQGNSPTAARLLTTQVRYPTSGGGSIDAALISSSPQQSVGSAGGSPADSISIAGGVDGQTVTGTVSVTVTGRLTTNDAYEATARQAMVKAIRTS